MDLHHPVTGEPFDVKLRGVVDLIIQKDGRPIIVEHKTPARRYGHEDLRFTPQPTA